MCPRARGFQAARVGVLADDRRPGLPQVGADREDRFELGQQFPFLQDGVSVLAVGQDAAADERLADQLRVHESQRLPLVRQRGRALQQDAQRLGLGGVELQRAAQLDPGRLALSGTQQQVALQGVVRRGKRVEPVGFLKGGERAGEVVAFGERERVFPVLTDVCSLYRQQSRDGRRVRFGAPSGFLDQSADA